MGGGGQGNLAEEAKKLNKLAEIDTNGTLTTGVKTTEIAGTKANREARKLGLEVTPKPTATPLKKGK